ncbi:MAG: AtpZ/AtpI family protein [Deltaproteobacteria bacterium]|nr:AtpZ/AtpI family protein [Deltaproteobacteria bacterium]
MPLIGPEGRKQLRQLGRLSTIGIEIAISVVVGILGGRWLDGKLNTDPYLTVLGMVLGVIAGFRSLYQTTRKEQKRLKDDE